MKGLKKNVKSFNRDVLTNKGYIYTSNAAYSSIAANKRLTDATVGNIHGSFKTLLDVGCGDGTYTAEIMRRKPGLKIDAVDPAREAVLIARGKYPGINFFVSNILDGKTYKKRKYDLAVMRGVLHHLKDPQLAIKNTLSLSDNIIIIEPNGNNPILKLIEKFSKYHIEHEERSFSSGDLKKFCRDAGGYVRKLDFIGYVPFFFPELPSKIIHFFQPALEKIPVFRFFFSAQIMILCARQRKKG